MGFYLKHGIPARGPPWLSEALVPMRRPVRHALRAVLCGLLAATAARAGEASRFAERVDALLSRMTHEEKASQLVSRSPAIPRLGIPAFIWDNEGKHAFVSCFPASIGIAASWNPALTGEIATAIADEARATHSAIVRNGGTQRYLCFWAPTINMARDPRWGRVNESFGEDPHLATRLAIPFIRGLQGDDPVYLKTAAGINHFAVYSEERDRHSVDAWLAEERVLRDYYLPHFRSAVIEGGAATVGATNNGFNGVPVCANDFLLTSILRHEWGFKGFVFSDSASVEDLYQTRGITSDPAQAAAMTVGAGCEINTGLADTHLRHLPDAVRRGLISESAVTEACRRVLTVRFRLGLFDPPEQVPYTRIPESVIDSPAHRELARRAAQESIVLLRNEHDFLPIRPGSVRRIVIAGPRADRPELGRKQTGSSAMNISAFEGLRDRAAKDGITVTYQKEGSAAKKEAEQADLIVFLTSLMEGEVTDRHDLALPPRQEEQLLQWIETGKPVVVVIISGGCVTGTRWIHRVPSILAAWYPGEEGGNAIADVLFGDCDPGGRLPVTFYQNSASLPGFTEFDIRRGLTYQHALSPVNWPFGHGLSYTRFTYSELKIGGAISSSGALEIETRVTNTGPREGSEVAQLYVSPEQRSTGDAPLRQLKGFHKIRLKPGESRTVRWSLRPEDLAFHNAALDFVVEPVRHRIEVGPSSANAALTGIFTVPGTILVRKGPRFRFEDPAISTTNPQPGEAVHIDVMLENTGSLAGSPSLTVDGALHPCEAPVISPGERLRAHLTTRLHNPGIHRIGLGGLNPIELRVGEGPAAFRFSRSTEETTSIVNQKTRFTATVTNTGGAAGAIAVPCSVAGRVVAKPTIHLAPGESREIGFTHVFDHSGTFPIAIGTQPPCEVHVGTPLLPGGLRSFANTSTAELLACGPDHFLIRATGAVGGSWIESNNGEMTCRDEYAAIYQSAAAGRQCVVTARIDRRDLVSNQTKAGIVIRNHIDQPGRSKGYVILGINGYFNGLAHLESDQDEDGFLDTITLRDLPDFPKELRLERNGSRFRAFFSRDGGRSWTHFHTIHLKSAAERQDVGLFVASDSPDRAAQVRFSGFTVEDGLFTGAVIEETAKPTQPEQPY